MVSLSNPHDYVQLFLFAGAFGAIGGIAYELLQVRRGDTGTVELPWIRGARYFDLGVFATMIVGAIAAVAISYFFTPEVQVKATQNGVAVIQTKWQIVKVIPLSVIVGSAGGAFLDAMRGRVLGQLNAQKLAATQAVGKAAVMQVAEAAKTTTSSTLTAATPEIMNGAQTAISTASEEISQPVADSLIEATAGTPQADEIERVVEENRATVPEAKTAVVREAVASAVTKAAEQASSALDAQVNAALKAIDTAAGSTPIASPPDEASQNLEQPKAVSRQQPA